MRLLSEGNNSRREAGKYARAYRYHRPRVSLLGAKNAARLRLCGPILNPERPQEPKGRLGRDLVQGGKLAGILLRQPFGIACLPCLRSEGAEQVRQVVREQLIEVARFGRSSRAEMARNRATVYLGDPVGDRAPG